MPGRMMKNIKRRTTVRWKRSLIGAMIWKVMPKNTLRYTANWQRKMCLLFSRWQHHAQTITKYLRKNMKQPFSSLRVFGKIVLRCLYVARIGRAELSWPVFALARSVTTWNKACAKHVVRLINYITQIENHSRFCRAGHQNEDC